jgi:hypothetical protein
VPVTTRETVIVWRRAAPTQPPRPAVPFCLAPSP